MVVEAEGDEEGFLISVLVSSLYRWRIMLIPLLIWTKGLRLLGSVPPGFASALGARTVKGKRPNVQVNQSTSVHAQNSRLQNSPSQMRVQRSESKGKSTQAAAAPEHVLVMGEKASTMVNRTVVANTVVEGTLLEGLGMQIDPSPLDEVNHAQFHNSYPPPCV